MMLCLLSALYQDSSDTHLSLESLDKGVIHQGFPVQGYTFSLLISKCVGRDYGTMSVSCYSSCFLLPVSTSVDKFYIREILAQIYLKKACCHKKVLRTICLGRKRSGV